MAHAREIRFDRESEIEFHPALTMAQERSLSYHVQSNYILRQWHVDVYEFSARGRLLTERNGARKISTQPPPCGNAIRVERVPATKALVVHRATTASPRTDNIDSTWNGLLPLWHYEPQYPIFQMGLNLTCIHIIRNSERSGEHPAVKRMFQR